MAGLHTSRTDGAQDGIESSAARVTADELGDVVDISTDGHPRIVATVVGGEFFSSDAHRHCEVQWSHARCLGYRAPMLRARAWPFVMLTMLGCGDPGSGREGGSSSGSTSTATSSGSPTGPVDSTHGTAASTGETDPGTGDPPTGPIGTVTVTLSTSTEDEALTDAAPLSLCLTQTDCFSLVRPQRDDAGKRENGPIQFDVHAHDDVSLAIDAVDRFELRSETSAQFQPRCLSVSFDGNPALCTTQFDGPLGAGVSFPAGTTSDCTSCFERGDDTDLTVTHGPFVGDRDANTGTALVWLRTDASRAIELYVSSSPDMANPRLAATNTPRAEDDFTAELLIDQLAAGGVYYYQLFVDGVLHHTLGDDQWHPQGVYRVRMPPPAGDPTDVSFALGSCARMFAHGNYDAVRDSEPEFLLSVGDYHYGNVLQVHFLDEGGSQDLRVARDELRWWYRTAHWEKSSLLATVPLLGTWDDHDYGGGETYADREAEGRESSQRTFEEYFANGGRTPSPQDEAHYFRASHGDVDFFVLDARWHRPRLCGFEAGGTACDPLEDPLGAAQTDWLIDALTTSTATFKFIAAGTRFYGGGPKAWTPFLVARDAMLERIVDANVTGVVFLSGGPHVSEYRQFPAAGRTWHELVSSPLSSGLGECSGATGQVECYDAIKNFLIVDVDTTEAEPTVVARVMTFDGPQPWSGTTPVVTIPLSALQ